MVKELVSKTNGLCPREFESRRCRFDAENLALTCNKKMPQELHHIFLHLLLKPVVLPPSASKDFACSVSSLSRSSLHYLPGQLSFHLVALAERTLESGQTINVALVCENRATLH